MVSDDPIQDLKNRLKEPSRACINTDVIRLRD